MQTSRVVQQTHIPESSISWQILLLKYQIFTPCSQTSHFTLATPESLIHTSFRPYNSAGEYTQNINPRFLEAARRPQVKFYNKQVPRLVEKTSHSRFWDHSAGIEQLSPYFRIQIATTRSAFSSLRSHFPKMPSQTSLSKPKAFLTESKV